MEVVQALAEAWNEPAESLTLRQIIGRATHSLDEQLRICHERLLAIIDEIRALAQTTASNAQARLKAIEATLTVINDAVKMHPTYSGEGRLQKRTPTLKHTSA